MFGSGRGSVSLLACLFWALAGGLAQAEIGVNLVSNSSFEEADGDLPEGWTLQQVTQDSPPAVEYPDALDPDPVNPAPSARTGDRYLRFVVAADPDPSTTRLDQDELIAVENGATYRLRFFYRFDEIDDLSGNPSIGLRAMYYYNAAENPGDPEDPQPLSWNQMYFGQIYSPWGPSEGNAWLLTEIEIVPGIGGVCVSEGLSNGWRCAHTGVCNGPDEDEDGEPDYTGTCEFTPEGPKAEWVRLRLETNPGLRGTVSVDDISLTRLVDAEINAPASSRAYDFVPGTCSPPDECTTEEPTPGFTAAAFERDFAAYENDPDPLKRYGFHLDPNYVAEIQDQFDYPTRFFGNNLRRAKFRVQLSEGSYRVSLYMGGYWRTDPRYERHTVEVNGIDEVAECVRDVSVCINQSLECIAAWEDLDCLEAEPEVEYLALKDYWYFKNTEATLVTAAYVEETGRGYKVYEDYIAPRYRRHDFDVDVPATGLLGLHSTQFMSGVVITPIAQAAEHDAAIEAFEAGLRDEFVSYFASYRPPEEFGMPVVRGNYVPTSEDMDRGYRIFKRHWMEFVEFDSRPAVGEPAVTKLSLAATPGEFEPATFSIWPLKEDAPLTNATVTVSDLQNEAGDVLAADAVRVWYLQQKPHRDNDPATSFSFIGTYLPDWGTRTLYEDVVQRAWLNVKVPDDTAAGVYTGQVTFDADGVAPQAMLLEVEVRPFSLVRPPHVRTFRGAGGGINFAYPPEQAPPNEFPASHNREFYRQAAYQHLYDHGFMPEITPYFQGGENSGFWQENGDFAWDYGTISGSADEMLERLEESPFANRNEVWIEGGITEELLLTFADDPNARFDRTEVAKWLADIDAKLGPAGLAFDTIYLHVSAEESGYPGKKGTDYTGDPQDSPGAVAWTNLLDFIRVHRDAGFEGSGPWPRIKTVHTLNTDWGHNLVVQDQAADYPDFPFLGMFHGISSILGSQQVLDAMDSGEPYGIYGLRGRYGTGFYHWRAGATGSYHEFYAPYAGTQNDDWDNPLGADGTSAKIFGENPGWVNASYSKGGRMIGTWFTEELREGVDDDAYLATLDHWIEALDCGSSPEQNCVDALATRQDLWNAISLDVDGTLADPELLGVSGRFGRAGLSLDRPFLPEKFNAMRSQAALAIEDLFEMDSDGDGLADVVETQTGVYVSALDTGTDPHEPDTDLDGVPDGQEVAAGTDPNVANSTALPSISAPGLAALVLLLAGLAVAVRIRALGVR